MKERPILFSAPMVSALLAGSKAQTRRIVKPQPPRGIYNLNGKGMWFTPDEAGVSHGPYTCPYGVPGDRLWVRETCRAHELTDAEAMADTFNLGDRVGEAAPCGLDGVIYLADNTFREIENTRAAADAWMTLNAYSGKRGAVVPSIHTPRWASRITLEVADIRVERLQDISEIDALAEGIAQLPGTSGYGLPDGSHYHAADPRVSYFSLWEAINGTGSVEANPWLWVVGFTRTAAKARATQETTRQDEPTDLGVRE